jgi:dihydroxyacetone kinase
VSFAGNATFPGDSLARLDAYPHTKVILRRDWDKSRVALISGGGSGHEPAHAGFVGEGMLTDAVCGEIFASPSVDAVLAAILAVTGEAGCLLIVKNYTGDCLNFGLAAERAKALGYKVEMVIVADDVAIPGAAQPRGVAGTLFVHKLAGYLAGESASLQVVTQAAKDLSNRIYSIGISLGTCTVPGNTQEEYLKETEAELGLGIHGEPGVSIIAFDTAKKLMDLACSRIEDAIGQTDGRFALMLNNLGSVPPIEMQILAHTFKGSALAEKVEITIGPAQLMTSLDMNGFSISLVELDRQSRKAFLAEVDVAGWPGARERGEVVIIDSPLDKENPGFEPSRNHAARRATMAICQMLVAAEDDLNALDMRIGDGDTGTTFGNAARCILDELDKLPFGNGTNLCRALSDLLSRHMGGSSGALMAILFAAAAEGYEHNPSWPAAIMNGAERMMFYGGAERGDRTLLDSLLPGLEALLAHKSIAEAAKEARRGADKTAQMKTAKAGRAAYVSSKNLSGNVDPGAEAMARIFETLAK